MIVEKDQWEWIKSLPSRKKELISHDAKWVGEMIHEKHTKCYMCEKFAIGMQYGIAGTHWFCEDHK